MVEGGPLTPHKWKALKVECWSRGVLEWGNGGVLLVARAVLPYCSATQTHMSEMVRPFSGIGRADGGAAGKLFGLFRAQPTQFANAQISAIQVSSLPDAAPVTEHPRAVPRRRILCGFFTLLLTAAMANASPPTHYVNINSANPTPPFTTWATAATNIQDAVDVAASGDEVLVTNGIYATGLRSGYTQTSNRVVIATAISVRSVAGPAVTVIAGAPDPSGAHGPAAIRCVYLGSGALLDGFTLTNGYTRQIVGLRTPSERGGGVFCETNAVLTNCVITGNRAADDGGGVSGGTLYHCWITGNSTQLGATRDGDGGGADRSILYNCVVNNNRGRKGGGLDECTLFGCVVVGNNGRVFGGGAARSTLYHCTVLDNYSRHGGGVSGCTVYNSIVYHNRAPVGPNYGVPYLGSYSPAAQDFYFSCTTPLPEFGTSNISADPQLASWSHLSSNSPCRGAASAAFSTGLLDLDDQPFSGTPSMGADELVTGRALGPLSVQIQSDFTNIAAGFAARFKVQVDGQTTLTRWDFGDGTLTTNQLMVNHAWSALGEYPVRLTAWNDASGPGGITATTLVNVVTGPIFYVNAANPTPSAPFQSWATAANRIQNAIDASEVAGRVVLVTNGVYDAGSVVVWGSMMNRVALSNGVVVRSVNGPQATILRGAPSLFSFSAGDGAIRCAYVGDGAVLDGFTLTNGYTRDSGHISREQGGGGAWCERRGTVTNCVFTGNTSALDGGGANGGIFYNCTFLGNHAGDSGGAVDDAILYGCILSNNFSFYVQGAASEAEIHSSLVVSNQTGAAIDSTLSECAVLGNNTFFQYAAAVGGSELINCVLRANGPGPAATGSILLNCTAVENSSARAAVDDSIIRNSIIYYNLLTDLGTVTMDHSCSPVLYSGLGNITPEPMFVDPHRGDYRLRPGSPCIDAGIDLGAIFSSDFNGLRRPLDGNRDGAPAYDMGAYEFNPLYFTSIARAGPQVRLCWFDTITGMQLQSSSSIKNPTWTPVTLTPGANCLDLPLDSSARYFRLLLP